MEYNCPNCGAPIHFQSKVSIYTTCTYCRSNIVRHDMDLEKIGEVSELLDDMSPFQVGTRGKFERQSFTLLGRIKIGYPTGMWSEWYALFDDGAEGWLAEAQGLYMLSFATTQFPIPSRPEKLRVGQSYELGNWNFIAEDNRRIEYLASEGELPFLFEKGFKATSVDLRGPNGQFLNYLFGRKGVEVFLGEYHTFESFEFDNLRKIDGWD